MKLIFHKFLNNIARCFRGYNLLWHLLMIVLTFMIVYSGFDWFYYTHATNITLQTILFPAVIIGGVLPIILPLVLFIVGYFQKRSITTVVAAALAQSAILAWLISSLYKAFTGRIPPGFMNKSATDISHGFHFGFFREGIFWGWPSSHTTVAFATATTLIMLFPKNKTIRILALLYAFYVGFGVSVSIHWFSEFVAGAILGSVIGITVGKSFYKLISNK